jgi:hypothetical protein
LTYEFAIIEVSPAPFAIVGSAANLPVGSFPAGNYGLLAAPNAVRMTYIDPHPARNYVIQWNLNVQRELAPNLTMMLGYIGTRGVHQPYRADDIDIVLPTASSAGYAWPSPAGSGTKLNTAVGRIDGLTWTSNSFYHSGIAQVSKAMAHGFQLEGSYTWSKSIDEGSGSTHGDPFANSIPNLFYFDRKLRRGLSDFNVAQNLIVNAIWRVNGPHDVPAAWALGGWQVGGVFQTRTGLPFTPVMGGDPLGLKDYEPFDVPNHLQAAGCRSGTTQGSLNYVNTSCFAAPNPLTLFGNSRRNSIIGPGLKDVDFSMFKNNPVKKFSEDFNAQFRFEVFNVFNHPNFNAPLSNSSLFDANGNPVGNAGVITSTSTTSRQLQFAMKIMW